jgi:hypothetical protein
MQQKLVFPRWVLNEDLQTSLIYERRSNGGRIEVVFTDHINLRGTDRVLAGEFTNQDAAFLVSLQHRPELDEFLAATSNALGWRCSIG